MKAPDSPPESCKNCSIRSDANVAVREWMFTSPVMIARTLKHTTLHHVLQAALVNKMWSDVASDSDFWGSYTAIGPFRWIRPSRPSFLQHLRTIHQLRQLLTKCWWLESRYGSSDYAKFGVPAGVDVKPKAPPGHVPVSLNCPAYEATSDGSGRLYNALLSVQTTLRELTHTEESCCEFTLPDWFIALAEAMCTGTEDSAQGLLHAMGSAFSLGDLFDPADYTSHWVEESNLAPGLVSLADSAYDDDVNHLCLKWDPDQPYCEVTMAAVNHWDNSDIPMVAEGTAHGGLVINEWDSAAGAIQQFIRELESWKVGKWPEGHCCFTFFAQYGSWNNRPGMMVWYDDDVVLRPRVEVE